MTYTWSVGFKARSHGKGLCHSLHNWCLSKRWTRQVRPMVDAESLFFYLLKITYYITYIECLARSYLQMKLMKSTYSRYN